MTTKTTTTKKEKKVKMKKNANKNYQRMHKVCEFPFLFIFNNNYQKCLNPGGNQFHLVNPNEFKESSESNESDKSIESLRKS